LLEGDDLAFPGEGGDDGGGVGGAVVAGAPEEVASGGVEGGEVLFGLLAEGDDDLIIKDEGTAAFGPLWDGLLGVGEDVFSPEFIASASVEAVEDSGGSHGEDLAIDYGGGGAWAIGAHRFFKADFFFMCPDRFAALELVADSGLDLSALFHGVGVISCDGKRGPAFADFLSPKFFGF